MQSSVQAAVRGSDVPEKLSGSFGAQGFRVWGLARQTEPLDKTLFQPK